jgi:hypothetical protein
VLWDVPPPLPRLRRDARADDRQPRRVCEARAPARQQRRGGV